MRVDSHQHFWRYHPVEYGWMTEAMTEVKKDFLPKDLMPLLKEHTIDATVLVQVSQTHEETDMLLAIADEFDFVKGVVGWVDLHSVDIVDKLITYRKFPKLKGFRHILQMEDPEFMLQPDFLRGIAALKEFGFTYDILIYPNHLSAALTLVEKNPDQSFVIDHLAKPYIKDHKITEWREGIGALAAHPNVYCKISGMVTEADWNKWNAQDFTPYMDCIVESFGMKRIMFGSDWPMCFVAGTYKDVMHIVEDYFARFKEHDRQLFFGENAKKFYKL